MIDVIQIGALKWYNIVSPSDENLEYLRENFDFHPLDLEDCRSKTQRPKIDVYEDYYFLILHFPYFDKANRFLKTKEVKLFWGKEYIVTVGNPHWVVRRMFDQMEEKPRIDVDEGMELSSDMLLYRILEALLRETQILLSRIGYAVDEINSIIFTRKAERSIETISVTRRNIILLDTIFKPQIRLFHKFESGEITGYAEEMEDYWGNILDYYQKMWDMIEDYEELIISLSTTFDSLQVNKTNEIIKVLTFISTTILPLTFITGLYGMNVALPFDQNPWAFWFLIVFMVVLSVTMILYFRRRRWL
jgi:magnesium transporter